MESTHPLDLGIRSDCVSPGTIRTPASDEACYVTGANLVDGGWSAVHPGAT